MITPISTQIVPTQQIQIITSKQFKEVSHLVPNQNLNISSTSEIISSTGIRLSSLSNEPKAVSGKIIGLSIGLPIGIFCLALLLFLIYFYFVKNSILISNPPVSPTDSIKPSGTNWFSNLFNIESYNYNNIDLEKNTKETVLWPSDNAIESKIQYNIGGKQNKKRYSHIVTPKYAYTHTPKYEMNDVNKFLYSKPPNIHPIGYSSSSSEDQMETKNEMTYEKSRYDKENDRKWNYNSPLSKWFLRSSLYLKDNNMTTTSLNDIASKLTPTIQLKHLKILNRVNKNYSDDVAAYESERSPILLSKPHCDNLKGNESHGSIVQSLLLPSPRSSKSLNTSRIQNRRSFIYDSIGPQVLNDKSDSEPENVTILSAPSKKRLKKKPAPKAMDYSKELPLTPHRAMKKYQEIGTEEEIESGKIYQVIQQYSPRLTDEINVQPGEYIRVLVTHNDGWCLVEKCTMDGTSKSLININANIKDKKYLNDDRGIIPGECIMKKN